MQKNPIELSVDHFITILPPDVISRIKEGLDKSSFIKAMTTNLNYNYRDFQNKKLMAYFNYIGITEYSDMAEMFVECLYETVRKSDTISD